MAIVGIAYVWIWELLGLGGGLLLFLGIFMSHFLVKRDLTKND